MLLAYNTKHLSKTSEKVYWHLTGNNYLTRLRVSDFSAVYCRKELRCVKNGYSKPWDHFALRMHAFNAGLMLILVKCRLKNVVIKIHDFPSRCEPYTLQATFINMGVKCLRRVHLVGISYSTLTTIQAQYMIRCWSEL